MVSLPECQHGPAPAWPGRLRDPQPARDPGQSDQARLRDPGRPSPHQRGNPSTDFYVLLWTLLLNRYL